MSKTKFNTSYVSLQDSQYSVKYLYVYNVNIATRNESTCITYCYSLPSWVRATGTGDDNKYCVTIVVIHFAIHYLLNKES